MKLKLLSLSILLFGLCQAQVQVNIDHIDYQKDAIPKVINNLNKKSQSGLMDLNGKSFDINTMLGLDPDGIESVNKKMVASNEEKLMVTTKKTYTPKLVSLKDLTAETGLDHKNSIFLIDQKLISGDYSNIFVDKNFVLQIKADHINSSANEELAIISIFTNSKKNRENSKKIMIK